MKTFYLIIISVLAIFFLILSYSFIYRVFISPPVKTETENTVTSNSGTVQIEILNGTNTNGLAKKMMDYLRHRDFDVLNVGNWKNDSVRTTVIFDRVGDLTASKYVAQAIGLPDSLIITKIDSSLLLNTTILIGKDFKKLKPFK